MDETSAIPAEAQPAPDAAVRSLREKRRRFQQLLGDQKSQLQLLERAMEQQIEQLCVELQQAQQNDGDILCSADFERQRTQLADEAEHLARLSTELEKQQGELVARVIAVEHSNEQLQHSQQVLLTSQQELAAEQEHVGQLRERLETQLAEIDRERQELATLRNETNNQRRHIARELNHQRSSQHSELVKGREALEQERAHLQSDQAHQASDTATSEADERKHEDIQRRFEMALEDLRDLKRRNAELEERLAAASKGGAPVKDVPGGGLNWEAQKRKLLASLAEDDDDDNDHERAQERLSIEGTIRITDEIVARKDQEIRDLKRQLADQLAASDTQGTEAAAIAQEFDKDELILQERAKLTHLHAELQQKLRQAEIDISVERARIARDRADLEEKMQSCESERAKFTGTPTAGKPTERRWWARMIKDQKDQKDHPEH